MTWLVRDSVDNTPKATKDNKNPEFSMSGKVEAKLATAESLKEAMAKFELPKLANDNQKPEFSMSGKVEAVSTESRLNALREALANHRNGTAGETPAALAEVVEPEVEAVEELNLEPEEDSIVNYSNLSGLDISRLPKNVPEAGSVRILGEIAKIEAKMRLEVNKLKTFNDDVSSVINQIRERNFTGLSGEYFDRVVAASEKKISESTARATDIVSNAEKQVANKKEDLGTIDPRSIKVFETLLTMSGKIEMKMPATFKGADGKYFWSANASGADSVKSMLAAMTALPDAELKVANDKKPTNKLAQEPIAEAA